MQNQPETAKASDKTLARLRRFNRVKVVRTALQVALLVGAVVFGVISLINNRVNQSTAEDHTVRAEIPTDQEPSFIALSYPGLTKSESLTSKIVNDKVFAKQMAVLKQMGYVTISQQDILNYYLNYGSLPEKALFLIFEDGIRNTVALAQDVLKENNYQATVCTYVNNMGEVNSKFITSPILKSLKGSGTWEIGTNGYRLSYINVYDRYGNYFGHLNGQEFVKVYEYLWRDYNHYLMDFKRDEDRLREESDKELIQRIKRDYTLMEETFLKDLGAVPGLYILMHSNTGAFGTDPIASNTNRDSLTSIFAMNFNRQGTCLNTLDSSIYDLSRLQVQSYFSTNHLLMRIQDDIGEEMAFITGDDQEAENWYVDKGVAEFTGNKIILTTPPRGEALMTLKNKLFTDFDLTITLEGNVVGCQSVYLRTDRRLESGIQVALENNELVIRDLSDTDKELFRKDLFELDGGPFISQQEDERNGLITLQKAIIEFDEDPRRVEEAKVKLMELEQTPVLPLDQGGTPYYPVLDISDRASRKLRIRLVGSRMSVWVDDKAAVEQLSVSSPQVGSIAFGSKVYMDDEYSQRFLYDDVYDAVFISPVVRNAENQDKIEYAYELTQRQTFNSTITRWVNTVVDFFLNNF